MLGLTELVSESNLNLAEVGWDMGLQAFGRCGPLWLSQLALNLSFYSTSDPEGAIEKYLKPANGQEPSKPNILTV